MKQNFFIPVLSVIIFLSGCAKSSKKTTDNTAPTIKSVSPMPGSSVYSLQTILLTFSEPLKASLRPENISFSGSSLPDDIAASVTKINNTQFRVSFASSLPDGTLTFSVHDVFDSAGNPLGSNEISYEISRENLIVSATPLSGSVVNILPSVVIEYSRSLPEFSVKNNYAVTGSGRGNLSVMSVASAGENKYLISFAGNPGNGAFDIACSRPDGNGNTLICQNISYIADTKLPVVSSKESLLPRNSLDKMTLSFSEPVNGADELSHYQLSGSGKGSLTLNSITNLDNNTYEIGLSGLCDEGVVNLQMENITDIVGNPLNNFSINYTIDKTSPTFSVVPATDSEINSLSSIVITFSQSVVGATDISSFLLTGLGAGSCTLSSITSLENNSYRLNVSGVPESGLIQITLLGITDVAGNPVATDQFSYSVDTVKPVVNSLPSDTSVLNSLSYIDLEFTEDVFGAGDPANYSVEGTGKGSLQPSIVTENTSRNYRIAFSGEAENGEITLSMNNITDKAGNSVGNPSLHYSYDTIHPLLTAVPANNSIIKNPSSVTITFSESVSGADNPENYLLSGSGRGDLQISNIRSVETNSYELLFSGNTVEGELLISFDNIFDLAGNLVSDCSLRYTLDFTSPVLVNSYPASSSASVMLDVVPQIIFSENVDPSTVNSSTIKLSFGGVPISGTVSVVDNHCFFRPESLLPSGKTIIMSINSQVTDIAGNQYAGVSEVSFVTGSAKGINILCDVYPGSPSSLPRNLSASGDNLFFVAYTPNLGDELWMFNSETGKTENVIDLWKYPSYPSSANGLTELVTCNGKAYFDAIIYDSGFGREMFRSDGTSVGTYMLQDIYAGEISSNPKHLTVMNNSVFFTARPSDVYSSSELYKTDADSGATTRVKVITNTTLAVGPYNLTPVEGTLYFIARGANGKFVLWSSDGTENGTNEVRDILPIEMSSCGEKLFFSADDGVNGKELWISSGSYYDTMMIKNINPSGNSNPTNMTYVNGVTYFTANDGSHGTELWVSDGSDAGTKMVVDLTPGSGGSLISNLTSFKGSLFFCFIDDQNSYLFKTDGTEAGTVPIKKIKVIKAVKNDNFMFIQGSNDLYGTELWVSDGFSSGTFLLSDINSGASDSLTDEITLTGNSVYFEAKTQEAGNELWYYRFK